MKTWKKITHINDIPLMGSRILQYQEEEIVLFKNRKEEIFALNNVCPHKQGKLSEGLVHGKSVTCPLHNWDIDLETGEALGSDSGCTQVYESKIEEEMIYVLL